MGRTKVEIEDHKVIIEKLLNRRNAGRNQHVWSQQFAMKKQRANDAAVHWLSKLRERASKLRVQQRLLY